MNPFQNNSSKVLYWEVSIFFAARNLSAGVISHFDSLQANKKASIKMTRFFNLMSCFNLTRND
jgi:hypothetical protein